MTTQINTIPGGLSPRLDIASRIVTGILADGDEFGKVRFPSDIDAQQVAAAALKYADALLAAAAESWKDEPAKVFDVDIVELRRELLSLRDELARVTKERDEAAAAWSSVVSAKVETENTLADVRAQLAAVKDALAGFPSDGDNSLRSKAIGIIKRLEAAEDQCRQLAAALAPLPEEEGLEELSEDQVTWCLSQPWAATLIGTIARHALASHARVKARKAREEGRLA